MTRIGSAILALAGAAVLACAMPVALQPGERLELVTVLSAQEGRRAVRVTDFEIERWSVEYLAFHEELVFVETSKGRLLAHIIFEELDYFVALMMYGPFFLNEGLVAGVVFLPLYSSHLGDALESPGNFLVWQIPGLALPFLHAGGLKGRFSAERLASAEAHPTGKRWRARVSPCPVELVRVRPADRGE